ncbi:POZ domain-containing protein [Ascobolus immersus RN42]|uniref:POZ domain-containing protein n=1 Tax=Ascobolus immersus RN42 TaxID=1160509 RepID=A0A3N4IXQ5_ASCIM|nr:POZ domain-containing protein [Ascobolus immersus RN42]
MTNGTAARVSKKGSSKKSASSHSTDLLLAAAQRAPERQPEPQTKAQAGLQLLLSGKWSDLTLRCGGEEFKVHRSVLCSQSTFFEACMESGMKESNEGVIDLIDERVDDVKRLLEFLYGDTYWEHSEARRVEKTSLEHYQQYKTKAWKIIANWNDTEHVKDAKLESAPVRVNARMFVIADKFGIPLLKKEVIRKMMAFFDSISIGPKLFLTEMFPVYHEEIIVIKWQWKSLLDAVDCCDRGSTDRAFSDLILNRIARITTRLVKSREVDGFYDDLMARLAKNHDTCLRFCEKACFQARQMERRYKYKKDITG